MTTEQKIIKTKVGVLELLKQLGKGAGSEGRARRAHFSPRRSSPHSNASSSRKKRAANVRASAPATVARRTRATSAP
jgi:hypothetical protein